LGFGECEGGGVKTSKYVRAKYEHDDFVLVPRSGGNVIDESTAYMLVAMLSEDGIATLAGYLSERV
jgi:hypothetical protein